MPNYQINTLRTSTSTTRPTPFILAHKRLTRLISCVVILLGFLVFMGWVFNSSLLKSVIPGLATMKVNTALGFILSGVALYLLGKEQLAIKTLRITQICAATTTLLGLLTLFEYLFGWNLGIDQLLFVDRLTALEDYPGRMSIATALSFSLTGTAIWLLTQKQFSLAHLVTIILGFATLIALISYVFNISSLYNIFLYSSMALHTAVAFALLTIGILFAYPDQGLMTIVTSDTMSGMMIRRLMPAAIGLPILLGALILFGERVEHYDFNFGMALLVVSMIAVFCLLITLSARSIYQVDLKRQQMEEALRQAEKKYRAIFENAIDGIYQSLPSGEVITANPALARMLGYASSREMLAALPQGEKQLFANPASYQKFRQMLESYKVVREFEVKLLCQDGSMIWASLNTHEVHDENGRVLYYEGAIHDVTERKQLQADNEQLTTQFYQAQKMESIGRLAGGIAHDFNNLLVPIIGYAEMGKLKTSADEKSHDYFSHIYNAAARATLLVRQILAFSRQQILEIRPLNLNQVIEDFQQIFQSMIGEDILLETDLSPQLHTIKADQSQLEQILMNLGVNARDAMPNGGNLIIETANIELDEVYTTKYTEIQPGNYVMLAVSDTGHGMDTATIERIFEPFFTTKSQDKGTGLGLATVFGIVSQHEGHIWVYSELNQGTTFKIYLPAVQANAITQEERVLPTINRLQGTETILVVEDELEVRQLVCESLKNNGYFVLETEFPEDVFPLITNSERSVDLLLTDVIMPKLNGPQLYEHVKHAYPDIKVLYMSGYTNKAMGLHNKLGERSLLLQKPFAIRTLLLKVREVLTASHLPD